MLQPADARDIIRCFTRTSPTARLETDTVSTPSVRSYRRRVHTRFLLETYSPRRPIAQRAGNGTLLLLPLFPSSLLLPTFMDQALDVKENVGCTPSRTVHGQNVAPAGARDIRRSFAIDVSFPLPPPQSNIGFGPGMAETARWCNILSIAGEIHGAHSRILPILDWGGGGEECSSTHLTTRLKWCNILSMYGTPWPGPGSGPSRRQDEYFQYAVPRGPDPFPRTGFSS